MKYAYVADVPPTSPFVVLDFPVSVYIHKLMNPCGLQHSSNINNSKRPIRDQESCRQHPEVEPGLEKPATPAWTVTEDICAHESRRDAIARARLNELKRGHVLYEIGRVTTNPDAKERAKYWDEGAAFPRPESPFDLSRLARNPLEDEKEPCNIQVVVSELCTVFSCHSSRAEPRVADEGRQRSSHEEGVEHHREQQQPCTTQGRTSVYVDGVDADPAPPRGVAVAEEVEDGIPASRGLLLEFGWSPSPPWAGRWGEENKVTSTNLCHDMVWQRGVQGRPWCCSAFAPQQRATTACRLCPVVPKRKTL